MKYEVKSKIYDGPYDLLLDLVKKKEVSIFEVNISELLDEFISYIKESEKLNLKLASDFYYVSSCLMEIKSIEMLPKSHNTNIYEVDPREELFLKLVEYKMYKEQSLKFSSLLEYSDIYHKEEDFIDEENEEEFDSFINVIDLNAYFEDVLKEYNEKSKKKKFSSSFKLAKFSVSDKIKYIRNLFFEHKNASFNELIFNSNSKEEIVVTFLAILELAKGKEVILEQEENFSDIIIKRR